MAEVPPVPVAVIRPRRRWSWAWLLPLAAAAVALPAARSFWQAQGPHLRIHCPQGHGLRVGDSLRYRGVAIGDIDAVALDADGATARVEVRLAADAAAVVARAGSIFWVVHPQIGWAGINGLDTLAGNRYLDVLPGQGPAQDEFTAVEEAPVAALSPPGSLEIILQAPTRGGVRAGSPVSYRQIPVGRVVSTALASDGSAVDLRVDIDPPFAGLIRSRTVFWPDGGVSVRFGLKDGLRVRCDSLETLLSGGIALATPPDGGDAVATGHRFALQPEVQEAWLAWQPAVPVGATVAGASLPHPLAVTLDARLHEFLVARTRTRHGWCLHIPGGLLGAEDLLTTTGLPGHATGTLQLGGARLLLPPPLWSGGGVAVLRLDLPSGTDAAPWPSERIRAPHGPEDCLVVGDPGLDPLALDQRRLQPSAQGWVVDGAVPLPRSWHGALVLARSDGAVIGVALVETAPARVAPVPAAAVAALLAHP